MTTREMKRMRRMRSLKWKRTTMTKETMVMMEHGMTMRRLARLTSLPTKVARTRATKRRYVLHPKS